MPHALRQAMALLLAISFIVLPARADNFGRYIGTVQAEWLSDGRRMKLLADFIYVDPSEVQWLAPKGWVVDGASIPRIAWTLVGGPFEGKYRDASVIHDVACDQKAQPWELVHLTFYYGMRASGVKHGAALLMYWAVYFGGPRWKHTFQTRAIPRSEVESAVGVFRAQIDPNSKASVYVNRLPRPKVHTAEPLPEMVQVTMTVEPSKSRITEADLNKVKALIEQRQDSPQGPMTLEEIRLYRP
jgi:hypothetical protein